MVGAGGVGKTAIATRILTGKYLETKMTVGLNIQSWIMTDSETGQTYKTATFDLGGQTRFKFLHRSMVSGSHVMLLVFDVSRYESLIELEDWSDIIFNDDGPACLLVGNKLDLGLSFAEDEVKARAEELNIPYILLSAKTGENFDQFQSILIERIRNGMSRKK